MDRLALDTGSDVLGPRPRARPCQDALAAVERPVRPPDRRPTQTRPSASVQCIRCRLLLTDRPRAREAAAREVEGAMRKQR